MSTTVTVPGCDPIRLTRSMVRGLLVTHLLDGRARRSNTTSERRGLVYWQAVAQLHTAGLIERTGHGLRTTPLGTRVIYALAEQQS